MIPFWGAQQLRKEELRQLRARQAAPADAEEDALSREFAGSVTLTFREDRSIVLTPAQARPKPACGCSAAASAAVLYLDKAMCCYSDWDRELDWRLSC